MDTTASTTSTTRLLPDMLNNPVNVNGDIQEVNSLASRSCGYKREKLQMGKAFFVTFLSSPESKPLANMINDTVYPSEEFEKIFMFYVEALQFLLPRKPF